MNLLSEEELDKNRIVKEKLCKEAEKLSKNTNWRETAERLKAIQLEWKEVGQTPHGVTQELNERLKKACDIFF